jgi:hypothetical protein
MPLFASVGATLKREIAAGRFAQADFLSGERELSQMLDVHAPRSGTPSPGSSTKACSSTAMARAHSCGAIPRMSSSRCRA